MIIHLVHSNSFFFPEKAHRKNKTSSGLSAETCTMNLIYSICKELT